MYIRLFHGRKDPSQQLDDWGTEGPFIGPANITWTYGNLKIDGDGLICYQDLIYFNGVFYGDFSIVAEDDPAIVKARAAANIIDVATFQRQRKEDRKTITSHPGETKIVIWMEGGVIHETLSNQQGVRIKVIDNDLFKFSHRIVPYDQLTFDEPGQVVSNEQLNRAFRQEWDVLYKLHLQREKESLE